MRLWYVSGILKQNLFWKKSSNFCIGLSLLASLAFTSCGFVNSTVTTLASAPSISIPTLGAIGDPNTTVYTNTTSYGFIFSSTPNVTYSIQVHSGANCGSLVSSTTQSSGAYTLLGMANGQTYSIKVQ